ncbi:LOW QUALITY PROTEIN: hypothetical protein Cgig2_013284 [Carnegiea gigantea]|uniref:Farnesyl pyrophosphate synthase n=1 Tax=Carnegiea gigantea TaxID=171969 RepID=A0A9Q1K3F9_9CARY|nr:LOW QUALITY PROTEIN: hypothetical protein Cgig2_013284 [Carnegiea gigantea]
MDRSESAQAGDLSARFQQLYAVLKSELLENPAFEHDSFSHRWVETMLDYNVPGGKLNRGWCIQWLVGSVLVLDDILDNSDTRRGRPCWFRLPNVGLIAINDGVLLWNHINLMLKKHFRDQSYYVDLLELFNEVEFQTASGEMLDLITGEKDLSFFTSAIQTRIGKYKTAYGTFYLPFACALLVLGERVEDYEDVKDLLLEMGVYFQVQDDYLDCFGDPEKIGKIGTDIQDFKCSWLVVKALEMCNEEQRKLLYDNYGKADSESVEAVKGVYKELQLERVYAEYEIEMYEKLTARIEAVPCKAVRAVLNAYLERACNSIWRDWENEEARNLTEKSQQLYQVMKSELLHQPAFQHDSFSYQWAESKFDYNVPSGNLKGGLSVVETYILLKNNEDDPDGVNDGVLLLSHINLILKKHFCDQPYYADLLDLFNEVKDFSIFPPNHESISKYKTAYGTYYLPFACGLLVLGERIADYEDILLLDIGAFQVQDDYLDCFGDLEKSGKIRTDIQDFKCSWLCWSELEKVYAEHENEVYEKLMARIEGVPNKVAKAMSIA